MRVGILSMQRTANYGSFFQALGLKMVIESLGHKCEFIDIKAGKKIVESSEMSIGARIRWCFEQPLTKYPNYKLQKKKKDAFSNWHKELGIQEEKNFSTNYDAVIIGSDEVFNLAQDTPWGFSSQLFGDIDCGNVFSYAGSFGYTSIDDVDRLGVRNDVLSSMQHMTAISVRDQNSYSIVYEICKREPYIHLDPTFIADFSSYNQEFNLPYKYLLIYAYSKRIDDKSTIASIKKFAKKHNLKIVSVAFYQPWADENLLLHPNTLMSCFLNAEYIITDTFHGTAFSAQLNKQFCTLLKAANLNKVNDMLHRLSLETRIFKEPSMLDDLLNEKIDYSSTNKIIRKEKSRSISYLKDQLRSHNE
jgi:hypothetical protein